MSDNVKLDGMTLTASGVSRIARREATAEIDSSCRSVVEAGREVVRRSLRKKETVYGVDTGFGELANVSIDESDLADLQLNLIRSHAAGTGTLLEAEEVRAILATKINGLLKGNDGVRWEVIATLAAFLDHDLLPAVPSIGSLGASGDLAPLAHLSLPLVAEGDFVVEGELRPAAELMARAGIDPITLAPKEGLGLINGTQCISALLALAVDDARSAARHAELATIFSTEALRGTDAAWDARLFEVRSHPGGIEVAGRLRQLMVGSEIRESHSDCGRVQDAYSIRCAPVVLGAAADVIGFTRGVVEREINSATGNPLCFPGEEDAILSGGNFHGQPVAFAADFLGIAAAEIGSIAERRIARLVDPKLSGLPAYLAADPGVESGYMVAHYTAAALVAQNKLLASPASVDSIPTSGNQEDHVSMGFHAAMKAREIVRNVEGIVAIELLVAAHGMEFHRPLRASAAMEGALAEIRKVVRRLDGDRPPAADMKEIRKLMRSGDILRAAGIPSVDGGSR